MEIKEEIKEEIKDEIKEEKIIPYIQRKTLILSISFRALNLEMSEYKMKIESIYSEDLKEPLITGLCETTIVKKYIIYI